ncbi:hypothetical protein HQ397_04210 [Aeromonas hydrophila]|uniref:hypothetical protein n=1 Tax=Aeromonas hydrophila TaxID=644 RepID=UPI001C79544A|nr:hypothetical protein [Aeromonas hydrophila]QWL69412.1 hypothetical protein HQ397_04210 [Aeromonas hydrophila]
MATTDLSGMGLGQSSRPGAQPDRQQVAPKFDATNVNDQLSSTLNSNSLLMRVARSSGQATAAQRGLGNSSIGAESSQRAMVDAALPIAQQNAQQSHQGQQSQLDRTHQSSMQDKDLNWKGQQSQLDRDLQSGMQDKDLSWKGQQSQLDRDLQSGMQDKDLSWKGQQSQLDRTHQSSMQDKDLNWKGQQSQLDRNQELSVLDKQGAIDKDKLAQQVVANTHGMYMSSIDSAVNSYNDRYAALVADKTMSAADKTNLINSMKAELNSTLKMYQQLYSNVSTIRPDWSQFPTIQLPGVSLG